MTFMGVGTIMNLTAGNLSEDRTDRPQTDGGKVLTMEEAVLGYQLYPKNLYIQWQGDRNVLTYPEGTNLMGEVAGKEKPEVLMTLAELNRLLEADLKGWPQYEWKDGRTLVIMRQGKRYEIDTDKKVLAYVFPIAKGAQNVTSNGQELLAYTKANNLYYVDANGNEFAVTSDEDPNIVNGQTVSRNEFGINGGIFWSPDGKQLAFYRKDESQVGTFPLLDINSRAVYEEAKGLAAEGEEYVNFYVGRQAADFREVIFEDAGHMNFCDLSLASPILAGLLGTGTVDEWECLENLNELVLNYFDCYLKDQPLVIKDSD